VTPPVDPDAPPSRRIPEPLRKAALAAAIVVVCEIGARVVAPGLDGQALRDFLQTGSSPWALRVYDWLVGGALFRGGVLAIGIMPYLSARLMMRVARGAWPGLAVRRSDRVTRWLAGGLALVQSYGFAKFAQAVPGVVANPGFGFLAKTMAVLTSGTIGVMLLSEAVLKSRDDDASDDESPAIVATEIASLSAASAVGEAVPTAHLLSSGQTLDTPLAGGAREREFVRPTLGDDRTRG
jgi:hypothetical protein